MNNYCKYRKLGYSRKEGFTINMKEIIERLIRTGKTTAEIQSEIIEFPDDVTTEYLQKIGFEETQAIKLKWKLRQNDRIRENEIRAEKGRRELSKEGGYKFSANANPDYILMDTCAMLKKEGRVIISKSSKVVVIESVLREIEKILMETERKKKKSPIDYANISTIKSFKGKMVRKAKFKPVLDSPKANMNYCDDKILYYLENLSPEKRPTLLTADANLASRAEAYGFDFIFIKKSTNNKKAEVVETGETQKVEETESEKVPQLIENIELQEEEQLIEATEPMEEVMTTENEKKEKPKAVKNVLNGIRFMITGEQITVTGFNKKARTYFITGKRAKLARRNETKQIESFDFIIMLIRQKNNREIRIRRISIVNNQFDVEEEIIKFINEIYQFDLPQEVEEEARELLLE